MSGLVGLLLDKNSLKVASKKGNLGYLKDCSNEAKVVQHGLGQHCCTVDGGQKLSAGLNSSQHRPTRCLT